MTMEDSLHSLANLQRNAARHISSMLEMELHPETYRLITAGGTANSEAYERYLRGIGYLQRFEHLENVENAIDQLTAALSKDPLYARAFAALGEAYWRKYQLMRDPQWIDMAVENCERAIAIDRSIPAVHVTLGIIHSGTGQYDAAIEHLKTALENDPDNADAYRVLAGVYAATGNIDLAEKTYFHAVELRPGFWGSYNELGKFYTRRGRFDLATEQFEKVIELTPDNFTGYNNLGAIYYHTQRWEEARTMFEQSLAIQPNEIAYSNLATMSFYEERYDEAARLFEELLALEDNRHEIWGFLAMARLHGGADRVTVRDLYRRAATLAERQLEIHPSDPEVLCDLASYYTQLDNREDAINLLERALDLEPRNIFIRSRAGTIYETLGMRSKAIELLVGALENGFPAYEIERNPVLTDLLNDPEYLHLFEKIH
jgi:eukaryotic-like serine/threonine-protein kinase